MQIAIEVVAGYSCILVPMFAIWAVFALFSLRSDRICYATELVFFSTMLFVAGLTVRTMVANDACWLIHTTSLGFMIVAGVLRRPVANSPLCRFESQEIHFNG